MNDTKQGTEAERLAERLGTQFDVLMVHRKRIDALEARATAQAAALDGLYARLEEMRALIPQPTTATWTANIARDEKTESGSR